MIFKIIFCSFLLISNSVADSTVTYLEPDFVVDYKPVTRRIGFLQNELRIYCYRGVEKTLPRLFESIEMHFDISEDDYRQYEGVNPAEVRKHYEEQRSLFSFNIFTQKRTRLQISPFGQHCIGLETTQAYRVKLQQIRVDFWRVVQITIGIILFVYAAQLSHNAAFFYMAGIAIGICSSFMLLIWLAGKLVPKRPVMVGVVIGGWAVGAYMLQLLWDNIQVILVTYKSCVFWYILITGMISFLFCYRWGPPKNERSQNIIKWTLQFFGLICIYFSSYYEEATVAIMVITAFVMYFPRSLIAKLRAFYVRRFPPKPRLLTSEEYYEQGVRETTKALNELRKYASSPECRQWRLMSQLKNPRRFASFVEGASHVSDEEVLQFEGSVIDADENDSDNDSEDYDNNEVNIIDDELSEEDEDETDLQRIVSNEMHPTPSRYGNSAVSSRSYVPLSHYSNPYASRYAHESQTRAARNVQAARLASPIYNRNSRSRPPLTYSNNKD